VFSLSVPAVSPLDTGMIKRLALGQPAGVEELLDHGVGVVRP